MTIPYRCFPVKSSTWILSLALVFSGLVPRPVQKKQPSPEEIVKNAPKALESIRETDLERHATEISSDAYEGRRTGTRGQIKVAEYFRNHFKKLGLKPFGDKIKRKKARDWFQHWPVTLFGLDAKGTGLFSGKKRLHRSGAWFLKHNGKDGRLKGRLVFGGTGSEDALDEVHASGKILVCTAKFGGGWKGMGQVFQLSKRADDANAKALVILSKEFTPGFNQALNMASIFPGRPQVARGKKDRQPPGRGARASIPVPTLVLAGEDTALVLKYLGIREAMAFDPDMELTLDTSSTKSFTLRYKHTKKQTEAVNVIGLLEGSSKKMKGECLVYSCHMDHLGLAPDGGVFNGADDNGSGCATVLEIAEAYAKLPRSKRPKRSILFVVVSGEELGLWGSAWFADHPTWPAKKIIADINMDMLGRSTAKIPNDTVAVTPTFRHGKYSTLAREAAFLGGALGLKMGSGDKFYARSDHYNFAKIGIPIVFFTDDEHEDYHKPTDTSDKLEYDKIQKIARLAFLLGYRTANRKGRPQTLGKQKSWFPQ